MKKTAAVLLCICLVTGMLAGCGKTPAAEGETPEKVDTSALEGTRIQLSDDGITVEGDPSAVHTDSDIVYYEQGKDFTYGEGTQADAHSAEEAAAHTVVTIQKPGQYILSGKLSQGQIAVDLGEDAEDDPDAVVTLVLDGVDITCTVAPAIIFYNVYECGDKDNAAAQVDTSAAGANVLIADGSENTVNGSYVARIYKPGTVELNEDGTEVEDAKKLHKYDAAFYSKMSMNVGGSTGVLNIHAENEGLDSELHLTINGGNINIVSGNDGINTNEDGVSVTTVNGGKLCILVDGATGEGDGIDSNGWLVINGGTVIAQACSFSGDAGIDSDMGIHINGGTVIATGNMLDQIAESQQNYAVFQFAGSRKGGEVELKNAAQETVMQQQIINDFSYLILSSADLAAGEYALWVDGVQMQGAGTQRMGGFGGGMGFEGLTPPEGMEIPEGMERPEGRTPSEGMEMPEGMERPEGMTPPEGMELPEGMEMPGREPGGRGQFGEGGNLSGIFAIADGGNYFQSVSAVQ